MVVRDVVFVPKMGQAGFIFVDVDVVFGSEEIGPEFRRQFGEQIVDRCCVSGETIDRIVVIVSRVERQMVRFHDVPFCFRFQIADAAVSSAVSAAVSSAVSSARSAAAVHSAHA